jgi:hypothetical protein
MYAQGNEAPQSLKSGAQARTRLPLPWARVACVPEIFCLLPHLASANERVNVVQLDTQAREHVRSDLNRSLDRRQAHLDQH